MAYNYTPDLETGNAKIDEQHKELIAAINNLLDACSKGKGRDTLHEHEFGWVYVSVKF